MFQLSVTRFIASTNTLSTIISDFESEEDFLVEYDSISIKDAFNKIRSTDEDIFRKALFSETGNDVYGHSIEGTKEQNKKHQEFQKKWNEEYKAISSDADVSERELIRLASEATMRASKSLDKGIKDAENVLAELRAAHKNN